MRFGGPPIFTHPYLGNAPRVNEMSDDMLHAVLNMPIDRWRDTPIDRCQRHARYVEASRRIRHIEDGIRRYGEQFDACTYNLLGEICSDCQCKRGGAAKNGS